MGPTPKPPKSRRARSVSLPMLPPGNQNADRSTNHPGTRKTAPSQTAIPQGVAYETAVSGPTLCELLEQIAGVEDIAYFKLCPGRDGQSWYCSYRWRWGQWAGHYVMSVVNRGDLRYGLILLTEKVLAVNAGQLRPTRDKFGD